MEKYSQFRDRGSGISPFIPHKTPRSPLTLFFHAFLFLFRLPFFVVYCAVYFLVLDHLPLPVVGRKLLLWCILAIPGIWWVDLQLDGVKRGSLSQQARERMPHPRSVIAAQFTSPIDALYLSAIFDPVYVISWPGTRKVRHIGMLRAILLALSPVELAPPSSKNMVTLRSLMDANPHRVVVVFPECGTTNGKGILPFSPSLLSAPRDVKIFPVSMRYTPQDITTPVPGAYFTFLWNLLSRPTHCIRVRIADAVPNSTASMWSWDIVDRVDGTADADNGEEPVPEEQHILDRVSEALARLGRNKRVGLTLRDKKSFVETWTRARK